VNPWVALDESLSPVPVVHVPIDNEDAIDSVASSGVAGRERRVSEKAKPHRAVPHGMVARWPDGGETPGALPRDRKVHGVQNTARRGSCGVPRSFTYHGVGFYTDKLARSRDTAYVLDICRVMDQRQLVWRCVTSFSLLDRRGQPDIRSDGPRDRA